MLYKNRCKSTTFFLFGIWYLVFFFVFGKKIYFLLIEIIYNSLIVNFYPQLIESHQIPDTICNDSKKIVGKPLFLHSKTNTHAMETQVFQKFSDYTLKIHAQREAQGRLLRGRAVVTAEEAEMTFVENEPRGARSKEVARGAHYRMVRRPDGNYTLTIRFAVGEKYLTPVLQAEARDAVMKAIDDAKSRKEVDLCQKEK